MRNHIFILLIGALFVPLFALAASNEGGIGVKIRQERNGSFVIAEVVVGGPADQAGIFVGEEIKGVDGISVSRKTIEQIVAMIRGPIGSTVELTLQHYSYPNLRNVRVRRQALSNIPTHWATVDERPGLD